MSRATPADVQEWLALAYEGATLSEVARIECIGRSTAEDWRRSGADAREIARRAALCALRLRRRADALDALITVLTRERREQ